MLKRLLLSAFLGLTGCYSVEDFNENLFIEGAYFCDIEPLFETEREFEPSAWFIFEEDNDLFISSKYASFIGKIDEEGNISAKDFNGLDFIIDFEGNYQTRIFEGKLHREYLDYEWITEFYISGEKEPWGSPTSEAIGVEGFYALTGNINYQDCIAEVYEEYFFPSPFEYPTLVFQRNNAIYLWAYGMRLQENINEDGTFSIDKEWTTMRGTFNFNFSGKFTEEDLEGTFNFTYDYFNNGIINCTSETEVYGISIKPWNQKENIEEAFYGYRRVYFTALDYVLFLN